MATGTITENATLTSEEMNAAVRALSIPATLPRDERVAARQAYTEQVTALKARWKRGLFAYNTDVTIAALEVIFDQAWEDDHSDGYRAVEDRFDILLDMFRAATKANR